MRWMRDMAMVAGLVAVGLGFTGVRQEERSRDSLCLSAQERCRALEQMVKYRAAAKKGELNVRGWPVTVDPTWFEHAPPTNPLLDQDQRPWVEVAGSEDEPLTNPPVRIAARPETAQFWYNPYQGIVRARVPVMVSDELAVETYNQINGTGLRTIFDSEKIFRTPLKPPEAGAMSPDSSPLSGEAKPGADSKHARAQREPIIVRVHRAPVPIDAKPEQVSAPEQPKRP